MTLPTFSPSRNPSFPYSENRRILTDGIEMHAGYEELRPRRIRNLRPVPLTWKSLSEAEKDEIVSFIDGLEGTRGPFWWTPHDKVPSPNHSPPDLTQSSGGALSSRTYYVVYTWYDAADGETLQSEQASISVSANYYMTVEVPPVPSHIDGWRLYAHETSGNECLQATITTGRSWTQSAALSTGTATPPSSNTLTTATKWVLASGDIICQRDRRNPTKWNVSFEILEQSI